MNRQPRATGALPPPGLEWQAGKTAASIRFVREASCYIETSSNQGEITRLQQAIDSIKNGTLVMTEWLTAQEFLNRESAA